MNATGITLCMIVKDEEVFLPRCLASVQEVVEAMVVVDTGSTDRTVALAEAAGAQVVHFPWRQDFAAARNAAFAAVRTPWILVLDADEELVGADRETLLKAVAQPTADAYNLRIVSLADRPEDLSEARVTRLFRHHPEVRWSGRVHEQIIPALFAAGLALGQVEVRLLHYGYLGAVAQSRDKAERNLALLNAQVQAEPHNAYALWQRAQTFIQVGRPAEAVADVKKAHRLLPPHADLQPLISLTWARALWAADDPAGANRVINGALSLWRNYPDFWYLRGQLAAAREAWMTAQEAFETAYNCGDAATYLQTDTGVGSYKALWQLVQIALRQGDGRRATATALVLVGRQPFFRPAWQTLLHLMSGLPLEVVTRFVTQQQSPAVIADILRGWPDPTPDEAALGAYLAQRETGGQTDVATAV